MDLETLRAVADKATTARKIADQAQVELNDAIRSALKSESIKTKEIVEITGLSRARLYQVRDYRR
ncbi:hypothetical protein [Glutamicibacter sp. Je.9.36]|uniref:hypothetical protein n=1 Tax=Glutamicibacter sp. Je.9.36 TaxID=3142837 RepID=UPI003DA9585C